MDESARHSRFKKPRSEFPYSGLTQRNMLSVIILVLCVFVGPCYSIKFLGGKEAYAKYPKWHACSNASMLFDFRTTQKDGLLMYTEYHGTNDYLQLALVNGAVQLKMHFTHAKEQNVQIEIGRNMHDGNWHTIEVKRNKMETILLAGQTQSSKIAFGSDFEGELETVSHVYLGGVPSRYKVDITPELLQTPFRGEMRNVLYLNCTCLPVRVNVMEGNGYNNEPKEACELKQPCVGESEGCLCLSGESDSAGCECKYRDSCKKDVLGSYHLAMDRLDGDLVVNPSGLDPRVHGNPRLESGVFEMALKLDGRSQWLRVSGPIHKRECFGDLDLCPKGYYIGMWVQFQGSSFDQKAVYMSNGGHLSNGHGIAMSYSNKGLEFIFKTKGGRQWRVESRYILPGRWYHVAASWDADKGLVLYINGHLVAQEQTSRQTTASSDGGPYKDFIIGRSNDNSGIAYLQTILVDEFIFTSSFKSEQEMREDGPVFHYHMSLNRVVGDELEAIGFKPRVYGHVQSVPGKIHQGISFSGHGEYIDLGEGSEKCLGNLEKCKYGFYISFFIRFDRLENKRGYIYSSPVGAEIYQFGSRLVASAMKGRNIWEAQFPDLTPGKWYFVEMSWSSLVGISLYIDGQEKDHQIREQPVRQPRFSQEQKVFIGRANAKDQNGNLMNAVLDDVDIFYGTRDTLSKINYLLTERPENYRFDFEDVRGDRIVDRKLTITIIGSAEQTDGKIGQALKLDGNREYVDFDDQSSMCFGNLDLCYFGVLYSMWIRPDRLRNNMQLLSTGNNGISLYYSAQKLYARAETSARQWEVTTTNINLGQWYFLELSFHPIRGLGLYLNNELVTEDTEPSTRTDPQIRSSESNRFYLGRGKEDMRNAEYAQATYDELKVWYADRYYLIAHGYIQRSKPQHFMIDFEELIDEERLMHPVLSIRLVGKPHLIPGKVNNGLQLEGRNQYADLGQRGGECFSNLASCTHGITIAAWMRFRRFENNMVFLSTGENGILMLYKDGYIQVSAGGRGVITTSSFESGRWYFVEITWHPDKGLKFYVDNELRGESAKDEVTSRSFGSFYIGRPNRGDIPTGRYSTGNFDVDEMEIWYGSRAVLLAFGYINRDNLDTETFSWDSASGDRISQGKYVILLVNGASLVQGRSGKAVMLQGNGQYIDMGTILNNCFGNIDLCVHGLTFSIWIRPRQLRDGQTFLATPTYSIFYKDGQLNALFHSKQTIWRTSTSALRVDEWQKVTMAWHPKKGLTMYVNDEMVDEDMRGSNSPPRPKSNSDHMFIGRSMDSDRNTASMMVDDFQVWYDDIDQLQATGSYKVQVVPINIKFDDFRNNAVFISGREIRGHGNIQLVQGKGVNMTAVHLGTSGYLDLGANFTCRGDLKTCRQGATLRIGLRPTTLQDSMVFFDSFPIRLYYKDGRLYGQFQTDTQVWTVDTQNFRAGQWQRVELSWHPINGLAMSIDGRRMGYQKYPTDQTSIAPSDSRTFLGRSLQGGNTYANTAVDSIEFSSVYKDSLPEDAYLRIEPYVPNRPVPTPRPGVNPPLNNVDESDTEKTQPVHFNGTRFIKFSLSRLPKEYFDSAEIEEFSFQFLTHHPDGLIFFHDHPTRKMYLVMKDGQLIFVNEEGSRISDKVKLGMRHNQRFDDGKWHTFKISRKAKTINITVDGQAREEYTFPSNIQFLEPADIYLGGTQKSMNKVGNVEVPNYRGTLNSIIYQTETRQGDRNFKNKVNVITQFGEDFGITPPPRVVPPTTTTPAPHLSVITIKSEGVFITTQENLQIQHGSAISFRFQTIKPDALLMFANSRINQNFIALEIYDGKLYLIYNFGGRSKRVLFSEIEVSEGQHHEVELKFTNDQIVARLDRQAKRIKLESGELLPRSLGPLRIGGVQNNTQLPWHTWAQNGYQGCLEDIQINGHVLNLYEFAQRLKIHDIVDSQCTPMPKQCSFQARCLNGYCVNKWGGYYCDCRSTDYTGDYCEKPAWTGVFNGSATYGLTFVPQKKFHVNNISFRFMSMASDGTIFFTRAHSDAGFMKAELEGGRMKITTNLGGTNQSFYVGNDLNDMQWHTLHIQRRGNQMAVWIDDQNQEIKTLPGEGYHLFMDTVLIGGDPSIKISDSVHNFYGYIRNFYIDDMDIFHRKGEEGSQLLFQEPNIPLINFQAVTFPNYNTHIRLPPLGLASNLGIYFLFKTKDPNGVIMFAEGKNKELFAIELFQGRLQLKFAIPARPNLVMSRLGNVRYNDDKWHAVHVQHKSIAGQEQLSMAVDDDSTSSSYTGIGQLNLQEALHIGGLPDIMFQKQYIREFLSSKAGYRGCLASVTVNSAFPNLFEYGRNSGILNRCQDIRSQCTATTCKNGGHCHDHLSNGTTWCDCSKTAFSGPACADEPLGYYFRNEGKQNVYGMLVYKPDQERSENEVDEIIMGVMTDEKNAVLAKLVSEVFKDFIEIKLVDGYPVVTYDTSGKGAATTITSSVAVSDGRYHVIKFVRSREMGTLSVDSRAYNNTHQTPHGNFDSLNKIYIGGVSDGATIANGTGFRGIIGGLYVNGHLIFPFVEDRINTELRGDVIHAEHPFKLGPMQPIPTLQWHTTRPPFIVPKTNILPPDIGGGGAVWTIPPGSGTVSVFVLPGGTAGTSSKVTSSVEPIEGAAASSALLSLGSSGPRAGVIVGIILGIAVLATSLMWAIYKCKPGGCNKTKSSMDISSPVDGSNVGLLSTVKSSNPWSSKATAPTADADVVDASSAGMGGTTIGAGYSRLPPILTISPVSGSDNSFSNKPENIELLTIKSAGGISNKGSVVGSPRPIRDQLLSTSASNYESSLVGTPITVQSYNYEGGDPHADYDLAVGVHPNYHHSSTLNVGTRTFSSSTIGSSYMYSMKTIRKGQQYAMGSSTNMIVTPGAMGEEIRVDCCELTQDAFSVVTGSGLGPPQVWNMSNGELLRIMHGEIVGSTNLHLVCNDNLLVGTINADLEINQYSMPKGVHNYVFQIWDFVTGQPMAMLDKETCSALTVMSDNDKVVFGRTDKFGGGTNIIVWDLIGNQAMKEMRYDAPVGNNDYIHYINLSQNDRYVIAGFTNSFDNFAEFVIFDMALSSFSVSDPHILKLDANPECTVILPRDEAVTGLRNGELLVWNLRTGLQSHKLLANNGKPAHSREVKAIARSEDSKYLVSASADGTLKLWDLESERHIHTMTGHTDEVWCVTISSDNEIIISGSRDETIRLWQLRSGKEICSFNAGVDVFYITVSRDKGTIVALGDKFEARKLIMLQVLRTKVKRQVLA